MMVSKEYTVGVKEFPDLDEERQVVCVSVRDFGHLVRASRSIMQLKRVSFEQFSQMIESNYDFSRALVGAVIRKRKA